MIVQVPANMTALFLLLRGWTLGKPLCGRMPAHDQAASAPMRPAQRLYGCHCLVAREGFVDLRAGQVNQEPQRQSRRCINQIRSLDALPSASRPNHSCCWLCCQYTTAQGPCSCDSMAAGSLLELKASSNDCPSFVPLLTFRPLKTSPAEW